TELNYRTTQAKLAIRAEQLLAITTKYAPEGSETTGNNNVTFQAIGLGMLSIPREEIYICLTPQGSSSSKNSCLVWVKDRKEPYQASLSLRRLFEKINHPDFVWINRNVFVNMNYEDYRHS